MNYYSEKEIRRILEPIMDFYVLDHAIQKMVPAIIPTSSDRERIRMELWKDVFTQSLRNDDMSMRDSEDEAQLSVEAFDKQFPK